MKKKILIIFMLLMSLISMHAANLTSPPISIVPPSGAGRAGRGQLYLLFSNAVFGREP